MSNSPYTADMAVPDQRMKIEKIQDSDISLKLMEMGILPGKTMILLYTAPLGGPLAFELGDSMIALRKEEAKLIRVVNQVNNI